MDSNEMSEDREESTLSDLVAEMKGIREDIRKTGTTLSILLSFVIAFMFLWFAVQRVTGW